MLLSLTALCTHAATQDDPLTGCWRSVRIAQYAPGGSKLEDTSGRCTLQYKDGQIESACATSSGTATTTYTYKIVRPGVYAATMTGSTFRTDLIGSVREYDYRVEGDRLFLVTHPPATSPGAPAQAVRVESESERMPCR